MYQIFWFSHKTKHNNKDECQDRDLAFLKRPFKILLNSLILAEATTVVEL